MGHPDRVAVVREVWIDDHVQPAEAFSGAAPERTVIAVASELGLEVIAEGVETEEQMEFLADLGCILMQGYLFGRPLDLQGFEEQWRDGESEFRLKER